MKLRTAKVKLPDVSSALANKQFKQLARNLGNFAAAFFHAPITCMHHLWAHEAGEIEAEVANMSIPSFLKKFLTYRDLEPLYIPKGKGFRHSPNDVQVTLPPWLSEEDVEYFASELEKTTITGGVDYYRALPVDWEISAAYRGAKVAVPSKFIIGDQGWCLEMFNKDYILGDEFKKDVPLLEDVVVIEGAAHFINQEKPSEINKQMIEFLRKF